MVTATATVAFASGCIVGRALAEDRVLATKKLSEPYRRQARWRLLPGSGS